VGPVHEAGESLVLVPPEPPVHCLTGHVEPMCDLDDGDTVSDHCEYCLVPLGCSTTLSSTNMSGSV